jgi:tRNA-dihydrouridine synthase B
MPAGTSSPTTSFWQELARPIIGLSPMDGVSDHPYRHIQKKHGQPAVVYTEFTSVEGVCHGAERLLKDFLFDETQRPIIAQIYGTTPDYFRQTAIVLCELGFDGIDINMGCPAKNVAHSGAGAALIRTPALAQEIIRQTKQGATEWLNGASIADCPDITPKIAAEVAARKTKLPQQYQERRPVPVSVKTRVGFDQPVISEWIPTLLELEPAALALHGRTLSQHYSGEASWELIGQAAALTAGTKTLILGNGDIASYADALEKIATHKTDGALIGRASFGNPFVFRENPPDTSQLFPIAIEHARLFEEIYADEKNYNFLPMRKHLGWYVRGIPHAAEIRIKLFQSTSASEVERIFLEHGLLEQEAPNQAREK